MLNHPVVVMLAAVLSSQQMGKWCVRKYKGENMYSVSPPKKLSDVCYKCKEGITTYDDGRVVSIPVPQCCTH